MGRGVASAVTSAIKIKAQDTSTVATDKRVRKELHVIEAGAEAVDEHDQGTGVGGAVKRTMGAAMHPREYRMRRRCRVSQHVTR